MVDLTPAPPTSPRSTIEAASLSAVKVVRAYPNPGQVRLIGRNARDIGDGHWASLSLKAPIHLLLDDWQDLSLAILQIPGPKPASGAMIIANNFKTCPEVHIQCRWHPPARKERL